MNTTDPPEDDLGDPLLGGSLSPGAKRILGALYVVAFTVAIDLCVFLFFRKVPADQIETARQLSLVLAGAGGLVAAILVAKVDTETPRKPVAVATFGAIGYSSYVALKPFPVIGTGVFCFLAAFCTVACLWLVARSMRPDLDQSQSN